MPQRPTPKRKESDSALDSERLSNLKKARPLALTKVPLPVAQEDDAELDDVFRERERELDDYHFSSEDSEAGENVGDEDDSDLPPF